MRLAARLRKLETRVSSEPIVLHFADGSTKEIRGPGDYLLDLFAGATGGTDLSPRQAEHVDLILRCAHSEEPGGGRMVEVMQALLDSPAAPD
ncbi:MAG: hypothetical protein ABSB35_11890 [Bryobacteraceae bacterium]|jgi:hypothetical protein